MTTSNQNPTPNLLLPRIETLEAYIPTYRAEAVWRPAMEEICRRHALDARTLAFAPPGSNVLFYVDPGLLIKLFPPMWAGDCAREELVLRALAGQSAFEAPRVRFAGEVEGWPYMVLTRLPGVSLDQIWEDLDGPGRERIAAGLGRAMAALHRTPTAGLSALGTDWEGFLQGQRAALIETQRAAGASPAWLEDIAAYYAALPALVEPGFQPVLINADLNPEHIFCRETAAGWEVAGFIDFGDAMLGTPCYEFVCPGFFLAGHPAARRRMLLEYGLPPAALDARLSRLLTAHILLHRFIDVTQFPELFPQHPPASMRELEETAWGFTPEGI